MHCVDLGESFPATIFLQNLASIFFFMVLPTPPSDMSLGESGREFRDIALSDLASVDTAENGSQQVCCMISARKPWLGILSSRVFLTDSPRSSCGFTRLNSSYSTGADDARAQRKPKKKLQAMHLSPASRPASCPASCTEKWRRSGAIFF